MKYSRIIVAALTILGLGLTACGHDEKKEADNLIQEDHDHTAQLNNNIADLNTNYSINLAPLFGMDMAATAEAYPWKNYDAPTRQAIRTKLTNVISLANRHEEIKNHKDIVTLSDNGVAVEARTNAQYFLASLNRYETSPGQAVQPTSSVKEISSRSAELNGVMADLRDSYSINVWSESGTDINSMATVYPWKRYDIATQQTIRSKLKRIVSLSSRIEEMTGQQDVTDEDTGTSVTARARTNARYYLASLDRSDRARGR